MPKGTQYGRGAVLKEAPQSHTQVAPPPHINLHVRARANRVQMSKWDEGFPCM